MKKLILFILLLNLSKASEAQVPDSLKSDWNLSGTEATFQPPATILDATQFGVIPNDGLDDRAALLTVLNNLPAAGAVVYFPSGTFNFNSSIPMPSNCIIKGAGSDSTRFVFDFSNNAGNAFNFSGSGASPFYPITDGLTRGSKTLIISGADLKFSVGDRIEVRQQNGSWDTNPATWAAYSVGHLSTVDSAIADTLYIREALRLNFSLSLSPEIRKLNCVENSGVECLYMTRADSLAPSVNYGMYFQCAFNCRVKGVESFKSIGAHILAETSAHIEISGCYFHESYVYDGTSTHGYGVVMGSHAVLCRTENNVFRKLRHAMMVKQGANGNVFGYNYSIQPNRSEFPSDFGGDISLHGHYPFANLFEGNICKNAAIDQAWGPNGPYNAIFRNRVELYGLTITSGTVQSDKQILVGNDITSTALFQGMYSINGSQHFQYGNRVQGNVTPAGTTALSDSSLYLDSVPSFWSSSLPWPSVGLPQPAQANLLPAAIRYLSGNSPATCNTSNPITTGLNETKRPAGDLILRQINSSISLEWKSCCSGRAEIGIFDTYGRCIFIESIHMSSGGDQYTRITLPEQASGILLVSVKFSNTELRGKIFYNQPE